MKKINISLLLALFILFTACEKKTNKPVEHSSKKEEVNVTDYWTVLSPENAKKKENTYSWSYTTNYTGEFAVQLLLDTIINETKATLNYKGKKATQNIKQTYTTLLDSKYNKVFEFNKKVIFGETGNQNITINTKANFKEVRIVPTRKNEISSGVYKEEWLTMYNSEAKKKAMSWFKEAKFGMFIHWGLYSEMGGMWKGLKMKESKHIGPSVAEWLMYKFRIPRAEYKELAKQFNPDKSFAQNFAKLAKDAGMKYMVITSKHHDGFALFDSKVSEFDIVDATPYKANALNELYEACIENGIGFGVYYSHGNDWMEGADGNFFNIKKRNDSLGVYTHLPGKNHWDPSVNTHQEYLDQKAYPQIKELIEMFPELKLIWFDGTGFITEEQAFKFYKMVYNLNKVL